MWLIVIIFKSRCYSFSVRRKIFSVSKNDNAVGRQGTDIDALDWISDAQRRGVGEILLNSIDADGTQDGFDIEMIRAVRQVTSLPLIASGGAGTLSDFPAALKAGADAVLAASVFHFGKFTIADVKREISHAGFVVR